MKIINLSTVNDHLVEQWRNLSREAWLHRENAYVIGNTKVGASIISSNGNIFAGCNVEHRFRSHDVHAEVNAIASMVAAGDTKLEAILVVAKRECFTPCGACMDWIFQFGGERCLVGYQTEAYGDIIVLQASDLMPYYPK